MKIAALVTWFGAALVGSYLLRTWIANHGLRRRTAQRPSRFAPGLIFGHGGLAASGLAVWFGYLVTDARPLAWAAFAILVAVATLGATMFGLWLSGGRRRLKGGRHAYRPRHAAEDHFPPPAVLGHGVFAVTTVILVLITAVRAGG